VTDARPRPRWIRPLGALLAGASVLALLAGPAGLDRLRAASAGEREPVVCRFRASTGLPCLGCGGTRALERMAEGDLRGALAANPLGAFTGLALWLLAAAGTWAALSGRARPLGLALGMLVTLAPGAFVWNLVWWWQSLPPGGPMR
jgi:hypothetical protein